MIVYFNGQYVPKEKATIDLFDRGFLFGDGVYEVIPYYGNGKYLGAEEHLDRLNRSLSAIKMPPVMMHEEWRQHMTQLLSHNQATDTACNFYIQVTRGADSNRCHAIPQTPLRPTVVMFLLPARNQTIDDLAKGFSALTREDKRRHDCYVKSICLQPNILSYQDAIDAGADETILVRDGLVREATSSNVFIVKNNTLITPPATDKILAGVTRAMVITCAKANNTPVEERDITVDELSSADEIWVTSSTKEIWPIITLNQQPVGSGKPGPLWQSVINHYQALKNQ